MSTTDAETLLRAMRENAALPEGPARNARAEALLAEAEALNDPATLVAALDHQVQVYNYSSERAKLFVPFARLLRMWDEHPEHFDTYHTHTLHWVFKWVSAGMLHQPDIPLASIEKWHGEMARRYRVAGHSERAVHMVDFSIAQHIGDEARAEAAFGRWLAADRDLMSDCHACELNEQGVRRARSGDDTGALDLWEPVLEETYTCAHEPHAVLAASLLPLLRLGRDADARAHHLRGIRLVRRMESMRGALADHIEFCALTGNEARGIELLAERPAYLTDEGDPRSLMEYLGVTALLMDRLVARGLGAQEVPLHGADAARRAPWTARTLGAHARERALALAARFDARNGTPHVSALLRERMDAAPLRERLPLGVRGTAPRPGAGAAPSGPGAGDATAGGATRGEATSGHAGPVHAVSGDATSRAGGEVSAGDDASYDVLLDRARELTARLHPEADAAWRAVGAAAERAGVTLDAADRAEIVEAHATDPATPPEEAARLFLVAAGLYTEAGDPGESLAARARAVGLPAHEGSLEDAATALPALDALRTEVLALRADGGTGRAQTVSVLIARARVLARLAEAAAEAEAEADEDEDEGPAGREGDGARDAAHEALRELLDVAYEAVGDAASAHDVARERDAASASGADGAMARPLGGGVVVASRAAEAHARLAGLARLRGDLEEAAQQYARGARVAEDAALTWYAVDARARLSELSLHLGDVETAVRSARAALAHGAPHADAAAHTRLRLLLADALARDGQDEEATEHALEATHWADSVAEGEGLAAWARFRLGGLLLGQGRDEEAAVILEAALTGLDAERHGDGAVVQARWWLGDCHRRLGEPREAAEAYLLAAELAQHWPEQRDHAVLANLAADALGDAGLREGAERAYARAGQLWLDVGNPLAHVRTLRARAWLHADGDADDATRRALAFMGRATSACEALLTEPPFAEPSEARSQAYAELARTYSQHAEILGDTLADEDDDAEDVPGPDTEARAVREEALGLARRAVDAFGTAGPEYVVERSGARLSAAWFCAALGLVREARALAETVRGTHADDESPGGRARAAAAGQVLAATGDGAREGSA